MKLIYIKEEILRRAILREVHVGLITSQKGFTQDILDSIKRSCLDVAPSLEIDELKELVFALWLERAWLYKRLRLQEPYNIISFIETGKMTKQEVDEERQAFDKGFERFFRNPDYWSGY